MILNLKENYQSIDPIIPEDDDGGNTQSQGDGFFRKCDTGKHTACNIDTGQLQKSPVKGSGSDEYQRQVIESAAKR